MDGDTRERATMATAAEMQVDWSSRLTQTIRSGRHGVRSAEQDRDAGAIRRLAKRLGVDVHLNVGDGHILVTVFDRTKGDKP
jgi:hypothetical protein